MTAGYGLRPVHVVPIGDLLEHETSDDCVCGPEVAPVKRTDGAVGWLITHHSLDGREAVESRPSWRRRLCLARYRLWRLLDTLKR